jgi:hypothetical protein
VWSGKWKHTSSVLKAVCFPETSAPIYHTTLFHNPEDRGGRLVHNGYKETTQWSLKLINSIELSPRWEAASRSATQKLPNILWNPKAHYHVHKILPRVLILSQLNPVHNTPTHFSKIHFNIIPHLRLGLHIGLFPSGFPHQNPACIPLLRHVLHALPIASSLTCSRSVG